MGSKLVKTLLFITLLAAVGLIAGQPVAAAGGDFANTDFAAAAPFTYNHGTGGGAYNDRTVGDFNDITEQLEGGQFACGDIVTFLAQIEMEATTVDPVQTAEFDFRFLGNSTGQRGAGLIDILNVEVNYDLVENGDNGTGTNPGAGFFGLDSGIDDDGGSTATLVDETFVGTPYQSGAELLGTIEVTDLEPGETVVIRIDVLLGCDPGTSPTGNLQGQLDGGRVSLVDGAPDFGGDVINTGQQTIPFLRIGDIFGAGEPLIQVRKKVFIAPHTCSAADFEFPVGNPEPNKSVILSDASGYSVVYCYEIENSGTATLFDVELVDDDATPGDTSDDVTISLTGLADIDGDADLGDLAAGSSAYGSYTKTYPQQVGLYFNTAVGTGNNGLSGGNFEELTDQDGAQVNATEPTAVRLQSAGTAASAPLPLWMALMGLALAVASVIALRRRVN